MQATCQKRMTENPIMNSSHKPNADPTPAEIAALARLIREEKGELPEQILARQIPAKSYTVRALDLRPARIGE